jgi:2-dehydro-3-deoxyglucarate aldolase
MLNNTLRKRIKAGELTLGSWITIGHPNVAEILANAGFDWLVIDIEHNPIDISMVQTLITTIQSKGVAAFVRVSKNEEVVIKHVLDAGADGIIVPMICTKADAIQAVDYAKYPPIGKRGVGLARAQQYGTGFEAYKKWVAEDLVVIAQIEHIDGIKNLEEIISVDGIDGTIIGPYDLSGSMGMPGEFDKPVVKDALAKYIDICKAHNFPMGFHVVNADPTKIQEKIDEGYRFIAYGTDFLFMGDTAAKGMKVLKGK